MNLRLRKFLPMSMESQSFTPEKSIYQAFKTWFIEDLSQKKCSHLYLACSTGSDSMCLLIMIYKLLNELKSEKRLEKVLNICPQQDYLKLYSPLTVLYFQHQMREASYEEERYLENLCKNLDLPFQKFSYEEYLYRNHHDTELRTKDKTSRAIHNMTPLLFSYTEEEARVARYTSFFTWIEGEKKRYIQESAKVLPGLKSQRKHFHCLSSIGFKPCLLLAHHLQDQIESFFLHLLRGTGKNGLAGMQNWTEREGILLARPLLSFDKEQLRITFDHLRMVEKFPEQWRYFQDESNTDIRKKRNFLRHKILPELRQINFRAFEHIHSFMKDLQKEQKKTDEESENWFCRQAIYLSKANKSSIFSKEAFSKLEETLFYDRILFLFDFLELDRKEIERSHLQQMYSCIQAVEEKYFHYPKKNIIFYQSMNKVYLCPTELLLDLLNDKHFYLWKDFIQESQKFLLPSTQARATSHTYTSVKERKNSVEKEENYRWQDNREGKKRNSFFLKELKNNFIERLLELSYNENAFIFQDFKQFLHDHSEVLELRTWRSGDRIAKSKESKLSLKIYFQKQKIPARLRSHLLLVAKGQDVIWVAGQIFLPMKERGKDGKICF